MSRSARLLLIAAAWALPVAWVLVALSAGPSDGSVVWSSPLTSDERWGARLVVLETYGDTALEVGDEVETIGGVTVTDLLAGGRTADLAVGDQVSYGVRRAGEGLARDQEVTVTLVHYAAPEALRENVPVVVVALLTVLAGSVAFWLQPLAIATRAFLGASALLPTALTSAPWGLGAVDVAGARGLWPHAVGEIACTLGVGLALLAACTLRAPRGWLRARPWVAPVAILAPFAGYAVWVGVTLARTDAGPEQTQALLSILAPSLVVAVPLAAAALALTISRARSREVRLAARLALLALVAGVAVRLLLVELPDRFGDGPILPWDVLLLLVAPPLLAGIVVALVGYRLEDVEPVVRRTVVQGAVAALVGTAFVVVASAVGRATDVPVGAILTGGVVALAVLPVGVALQRGFRRLVYGDHDLRRTVVAELRRLDATTAPAEALTETLTLLSRRLRLAYAGIETDRDEEPLLASVGERQGGPLVTVELVAGGTRLGSLHLEAAPDRDPFRRGDQPLLEEVGVQIGAVVQAVLANRELKRSRQEIVSAREEERRRLRRDLHDGLGPSLATLAMRLESAEELIATDPAQATVAVAGLADLARDEITEVRRLVDGLRPAALDQLGLVTALRQRAAQHDLSAGEGSLVWAVEAGDDVEPLPAAVEVAAYLIALEAVNNAVRHSAARACTVSLTREGGDLLVHVRDDGQGLADERPGGVGLVSMRERAEEVGGTCVVTSDETGTLVAARLPLGGEGG
jgi:signal transduction histidine kinase